jgi:nucleoside 2-deoxyribosyltransferase
MSDIKPIETKYKGYRFRSRLEARWAVFFDAAGIDWEYEREGFDLDGEYYLPDFYLPKEQCLVEIKPTQGPQVMPAIYLAGKMSNGYDYRGIFNRHGRSYSVIDFDLERKEFPVETIQIGDHVLNYTGPYTASDDHGCAHAGQHKFATCGLTGAEYGAILLRRCEEAVRRCDIFFAHFETPDQFGTLVELGWARALGKRIWMTMTNELFGSFSYVNSDDCWYQSFGDHDMWFAQFCSEKFIVTDEPMKQIAQWLSEEISFNREQHLASLLLDGGKDIAVAYGDPGECSFYPMTPQWFAELRNTVRKNAANSARSARFEHGENR